MIGKKLADILDEINPTIVRNIKSSQEISIKTDQSIVTTTDRQVEQLLSSRLKKLLPESTIIGEESAPTDPQTIKKLFQSDYLWAIDPIDGTLNFAAGIPLFVVSIGLLKRNNSAYSIVSGAISFPMFSEIYYTQKNKTYLRETIANREGEVERLVNESVAVLLVPSSFHRKYKIERINRLTKNVRQFGCTAANLLYVSLGKATATYTSAHLWDIAGSLAIAKTFGLFPRELSTGKVKKHFTNEDFLFGDPKQDWRIKETLVLCEETYFADMQDILKG